MLFKEVSVFHWGKYQLHESVRRTNYTNWVAHSFTKFKTIHLLADHKVNFIVFLSVYFVWLSRRIPDAPRCSEQAGTGRVRQGRVVILLFFKVLFYLNFIDCPDIITGNKSLVPINNGPEFCFNISFSFKEVVNRKTRLTHNWTECPHRNFFSWYWYDNCKPFFMIFLMVLCLRNKAEKLHSNCLLFLVPYFQNLILQHLGIEKHSSYLLFERYILVSLSSVDFCCFILEGILFLKIGFTRKSIFYPHPFGGIRMTGI